MFCRLLQPSAIARKSKIHRNRFFSNNKNSNPKNEKFKIDTTQRGPITFTSLGIFFIVAAGIVVYYNIEREKKVEKVSGQIAHVGKPKLGGPWVLVDHNGIPRTDASYRGKMNLLYFGFTHCPDICPNELVKVKKIVNAAALNGIEIKPIFISVDPVRDTVGQLKFYSKDFHPSFDFLTGTPEQVGNVAKSFRVYYSKANEDADDESEYLVDHSIVLYLISPDGEFLDFFTQKMQVNDIVDRISVHYKNVTKK